MSALLQHRYGPAARDRRPEARDPGRDGGLAALESFYYAFNSRDSAAMADVWSSDPLAQLNNPLGGLLRGGEQIAALYRRIFTGTAKVSVEFADIAEYSGTGWALFAGRETGTCTVPDRPPLPLAIRTTRYFEYDPNAGRWLQLHHHGSIDNPTNLHAYQTAVA